ncbi:MAG: hypothetical protein M1358_05890 [Chloroflexi bacterium]|nr:hypothetical protein [Chloroflexota bacterium]
MFRRWWNGWMAFARATGHFQSRVLLGLFYFFLVTPFGVAVRALGDPLRICRGQGMTNWTLRNETGPTTIDRARRQY